MTTAQSDRSEGLWPFVILAVLGAGWGATQPLTKVAVSQGYLHFGLIFWQLVIGAVFMCGLLVLRGKPLPFRRAHMRIYLVIALIGTLLPNTASYQAITHLPSGLISILLSLVPILAFPIALILSLERFRWRRFAGLGIGLFGVWLLVWPEASLPERALLIWVPVALVAPLFYALEGNVVAKWGTAGLDAMQVLAGASLVGTALALPLAVFSGQWIDPRPPWGAPDLALMASSMIHVLVYAVYVWLVGRAGSVFAAQVSYLVTGFGVLWAMMFLGERYSGYIWVALAAMFCGMFLVQPRRSAVPVPPRKDAA